MTEPHVFVETNFLFGVFRMPSKRHRDALALKARFGTGGVKLYVPYLCFQEARNLIAKSLPSNRCSDLLELHRFAAESGTASWDFDEVRKLLDAALGEVTRTKAVHQRELGDFAVALGNGILHGSNHVFSFLEALDLDDDSLKYNDKLILSSVRAWHLPSVVDDDFPRLEAWVQTITGLAADEQHQRESTTSRSTSSRQPNSRGKSTETRA